MRNVADHLQRGIGQILAQARQAIGETEGEAEQAADKQAGQGAKRADRAMDEEIAGQRQPHAGLQYGDWRGHDVVAERTERTARLPDHEQRNRQQPAERRAPPARKPGRPRLAPRPLRRRHNAIARGETGRIAHARAFSQTISRTSMRLGMSLSLK